MSKTSRIEMETIVILKAAMEDMAHAVQLLNGERANMMTIPAAIDLIDSAGRMLHSEIKTRNEAHKL